MPVVRGLITQHRLEQNSGRGQEKKSTVQNGREESHYLHYLVLEDPNQNVDLFGHTFLIDFCRLCFALLCFALLSFVLRFHLLCFHLLRFLSFCRSVWRSVAEAALAVDDDIGALHFVPNLPFWSMALTAWRRSRRRRRRCRCRRRRRRSKCGLLGSCINENGPKEAVIE